MARDTDSLFSVLKKMRDNRVSCIPIEKQVNPCDQRATRTVGLAFLTDIMFLLRLPNFWRHLDEPVINFVTDLNGLEEDFQSTDSTSLQEAVVKCDKIDDSEAKKVTAPIEGIMKEMEESEDDKRESDKEKNGVEIQDVDDEDEDEEEEGEEDESSEEEKEEEIVYFKAPAG